MSDKVHPDATFPTVTDGIGAFIYRHLYRNVPREVFIYSMYGLQGLGVIAVIYGIVFIILHFISAKRRKPSDFDAEYLNFSTNKKRKFRTVFDKPEVSLSVIVPAYNETERITIMLDEAIEYLLERQKKDKSFTFEIVVVDDGSSDNTSKYCIDLFKKYHDKWGSKLWNSRELRVLTLKRNRGKGGAVIQGIYVSRGSKILFADADGATEFKELENLEVALEENEELGTCLAIGSRAHIMSTDNDDKELEKTNVKTVKRSPLRKFLMHGFHFLVNIFGVSKIKDTQCGFKLFTRSAAQMIIPNMHCERWIFDIELLIIAFSIGIPVIEVPVNWHEVEGTKISLIKDSILMLIDLVLIRTNYLLRVWRVRIHPPSTVSSKKMQTIRMQIEGIIEDNNEILLKDDEYENDYSEDIPDNTKLTKATKRKSKFSKNDIKSIENDF